MKNETFFLPSQSLSGAAGPNLLMVLLPSSSNVGKEKTKTIHVNKKSGGGNKTKPKQAFIIKEMSLSFYSVKQNKKMKYI